MDKEIPKDLTFPKLRFKNVKEVKKLDEYGPPPDNDCFFLRYPHQLGAKYWVFFSFRSLKTREKYISFAQFVYFLREVCLRERKEKKKPIAPN